MRATILICVEGELTIVFLHTYVIIYVYKADLIVLYTMLISTKYNYTLPHQ